MWFLYLDESGDLGFDFENKNPSQYFTVTILALRTVTNNRSLINAVKKTLRRKLNPKRRRRRRVTELKGSKTTLEVKEYFFRQVSGIRFAIYSLTLNKRRLYGQLQAQKEITYNYLARLILEEIPFEHAETRVHLIMHRRKSLRQAHHFNRYVAKQLRNRLPSNIPMDIFHKRAEESPGLQAVDMFCHGIFKRYEWNDTKWGSVFQGKVVKDVLYLK